MDRRFERKSCGGGFLSTNSNVDRLRFSYVKILIKKKENSSYKILL